MTQLILTVTLDPSRPILRDLYKILAGSQLDPHQESNSLHLLGTYYVPGTFLIIILQIFTNTLLGMYYYRPHFRDEEIKAQRDSVTCSGAHSKQMQSRI